MPVWLTLAHAFLVIPLVHYPLLTSKPRLPQWIELLVPNLAYALLWPLCRCNNPVYDYTWSLIISGFLSVRLLESSLLKNTETWTRHNYIEFLITSNNPRFTRKHVKDAWDAAGLRKWKPEDRGVGFYVGVVARQCVFLGVYAATIAYTNLHPFTPGRELLDLRDLESVRGIVVLAVMGFCKMQISYEITVLAIAILFQVPYFPLFKNPFLSTSLHEFWSRRWNIPMKSYFHHVAFVPTLKFLEYIDPPRNSAAKRNPIHLSIACMAAFFQSALNHEFGTLLFFLGEQPLGGSLVFFLTEGVLCILEYQSDKLFGKSILWKATRIMIALAITLIVSPLFLHQFYRVIGIYHLAIVPQSLIHLFETLFSTHHQ